MSMRCIELLLLAIKARPNCKSTLVNYNKCMMWTYGSVPNFKLGVYRNRTRHQPSPSKRWLYKSPKNAASPLFCKTDFELMYPWTTHMCRVLHSDLPGDFARGCRPIL